MPSIARLAESSADGLVDQEVEISEEKASLSLPSPQGDLREEALQAEGKIPSLSSENQQLIIREQKLLESMEVKTGFESSLVIPTPVVKPGIIDLSGVKAEIEEASQDQEILEPETATALAIEKTRDANNLLAEVKSLDLEPVEEQVAHNPVVAPELFINNVENAYPDTREETRYDEYQVINDEELVATINAQKQFFQTKIAELDQQIQQFESHQGGTPNFEGLVTALQQFEGKITNLQMMMGQLSAESAAIRKHLGDNSGQENPNLIPRLGKGLSSAPRASDAFRQTSYTGDRDGKADSGRSESADCEETLPRAIVAAAHVPLRTGPARLSSGILYIFKGAELDVERVRGEWLKVVTANGVKGWVNAEALKLEEI